MDMFNSFGSREDADMKAEFKRNRIAAKPSPVPMTNSGGAMLIVIFVILCLTVFGFLAFSTAFADRKLTDKNIKNQVEYYNADSAAELKIVEIYRSLNAFSADTSDMDALAEKNGGLDVISGSDGSAYYDAEADVITVDFITRQSENHFIYTRADFFIGADGKWSHKINNWQSLTEWIEYSYQYNLWDGM